MERYSLKNESMISSIVKIDFEQFLGYSSSENTWEPESHVNNCQALIQAFENEQAKKKQSSPSTRRSNGLPSKENRRTSRSRSRHSTTKQRMSNNQANQSLLTDDEEEEDAVVGRKRPNSKASPRRSCPSAYGKQKGDASSDKKDEQVLDTVKIESIVDSRRNRLTNQVEYQVHAKSRKNFWISSDALAKANAEKIIQYFEKNYV